MEKTEVQYNSHLGKAGTSMEKLDLDEESLSNIDVILLIFQLYETNICILKKPFLWL